MENKKNITGVEGTFSELLEIVDTLRKECPWDREQKVEDIKFKLVEESYEAIDRFDKGDLEGFASELGDVLLVVLFMIRIMQDEGKFDSNYVLKKLIHKLIERHPHVFGEKKLDNAKDVLRNWENMKGKIKKDDFNISMPSLYLIYRIIEKIRNKLGSVEDLKERFKVDRIDNSDIPELIFRYSVLCALDGINLEDEMRKRAIQIIEKLENSEDFLVDSLFNTNNPKPKKSLES